MGILNIRPVVRQGSKVVIGIAGPSGSGKTYTALKIARGMVDKPSEIGLLDTENRRGSLYDDILDGQFLIGDLFAPFSPSRYRKAIEEFQAAGVKVLIIDSVSHEWEGDGGCEDIADTGGKIANWKLAKAEHKKFISALLQADMHIIACVRAREKMSFKNPKAPESLGIQPVCEKNFMFEMTVSMMMFDGGQSRLMTKLPASLIHAFGNTSGYLDEGTGRQLIEWVDRGERINQEFEHWRARLQMATNGGIESLKAEYKKMPPTLRTEMNKHWEQLESSAKEYDAIAALEAVGESQSVVSTIEITPETAFNPAEIKKREQIKQPEQQKQQNSAEIEDF